MTRDLGAITDAELCARSAAQVVAITPNDNTGEHMSRTPLPLRRQNVISDLEFAGRTYSICVGFYGDGRPGEVFADGAKEGSDMRATLSDACVLISIALQNGISREDLARSLGRVPQWRNGVEADGPASIIGAVVEALP